VTASQNEINAYWAPSPSPYQPPRGFYSSANFGTHGMGDPGPGNWGLGCKVDGVQTPCGIVLGGLRTGGVGNVVGGTGVTIGAGPLMPEVISAISTFAMAGNVRTRIVPKTIPGAGTGLKMGIAGGDIPASQDVPATTSYVVVTEYVGAISGFPVLGGDGIGQQGGGTGSAPACGLLGDPKYEDAIKKALKKAPKPKSVPGAGAGIFGKLGKALGVIWTVLVDLEGQGPSPEADSPKYPKFVITHRYTKGLGAGEFKPKMREISTFEKKSTDPEVKFNVPFLGVYYGEKEKWQLAKILGVPEVPGLWARYTPTDEGEAHWDLLVPVGMSDDKFKEGLSAYARRILDKPLPPCK